MKTTVWYIHLKIRNKKKKYKTKRVFSLDLKMNEWMESYNSLNDHAKKRTTYNLGQYALEMPDIFHFKIFL